MSRFSTRLVALWIGLCVFFLDGISKVMTHLYLPLISHDTLWYPYNGIGIFKNFWGIEFSISHATNRGAAWGLLSEYQYFLLAFRILLVIGLVVYFFKYTVNQNLFIPLGLIIAGATGNIMDAFIYGHVVDMFHFVLWGYDFPVFNVADTAIFIGVSLLALDSCCSQPAKIKKKTR